MKKTVIRYGLFSGLFMVAFFLVDSFFFENTDFDTREILGWVGIVLSTIFIFFGIKHYRDRHNNGSITFGKGLLLGLLILVVPSLAFGIFNVIYVELNPEFMDKYYNYQVSQIKASLPATEAAAKIEEMAKQKEMFSSPVIQFFAMFLSVFAVGLIVTVISALLLRRRSASVQAA
jgi:hypothetical protein